MSPLSVCAAFTAPPLVEVLLLQRTSWGQQLGVRTGVSDGRHELVSAPHIGAAAAAGWRPPVDAVTGAEWPGGRALRTGVACAGLIPPGTCAEVPSFQEVFAKVVALQHWSRP